MLNVSQNSFQVRKTHLIEPSKFLMPLQFPVHYSWKKTQEQDREPLPADSPPDCLRWVWVFHEWTRIYSGIQFTRHFCLIRSCGNETNRQTCGQRSSVAAGSKCRALAIYFHRRICYQFHISRCNRRSDLGLCTTSVFAKKNAASQWRLAMK